MEVGRQHRGGMWWRRSFREPVIQVGKACQASVSEKEIQKKEEGMLCFSELGLGGVGRPQGRASGSSCVKVSMYQFLLSETVSRVSSVL